MSGPPPSHSPLFTISLRGDNRLHFASVAAAARQQQQEAAEKKTKHQRYKIKKRANELVNEVFKVSIMSMFAVRTVRRLVVHYDDFGSKTTTSLDRFFATSDTKQ